MNELVHFNRAKQELVLATKIDEVKEIRDRAEALRVYIKQTGEGLVMQNQCAEIKIRAERRAGEILEKQGRKQGERDQTFEDQTFKKPKLEELGISRFQSHNWQETANIPEEKFEEHIAVVKDSGKELTSIGVQKLAKAIKREDGFDEREIVILPEGKFEVIVIDPPWPYGTGYDSETRRVGSPYPEMSIEDIAKIEVPAFDNCVLWLWTTHRFLRDSFDLLEDWGFEYKLTSVWNKEKLGMGRWLRCQAEFCLLGIKGSPEWNLTNERDIISEARREHSRKPEKFYEMVEKVCSGKKLDYFSRQERDGWAQFGNEIQKYE